MTEAEELQKKRAKIQRNGVCNFYATAQKLHIDGVISVCQERAGDNNGKTIKIAREDWVPRRAVCVVAAFSILKGWIKYFLLNFFQEVFSQKQIGMYFKHLRDSHKGTL